MDGLALRIRGFLLPSSAVVPLGATVLLSAESPSGTGRAAAITHRRSRWRDAPLASR